MRRSLVFLLVDDKGSRHFFGFCFIGKITQRLFASFWNISGGQVSDFSVVCCQQMLEYCPNWMRAPIFTFLDFCCYGGRCVGETADVFTGFLPRQWCAWGYVLVEAHSSCISSAASKTELLCLPRFRLPFFLLLLTIARCAALLGW